MSTFATDYYLFVFAACLGVLQVAASLGGLKGLLIAKSPLLARLSGLAVAVAAFVWFFASADRNLNDYQGGLDANVQARFFFFGSLSAVVTTLIVSSLVNLRMRVDGIEPGEGLGALERTSYVGALALSLRYWWREWRRQMKPYFFG